MGSVNAEQMPQKVTDVGADAGRMVEELPAYGSIVFFYCKGDGLVGRWSRHEFDYYGRTLAGKICVI